MQQVPGFRGSEVPGFTGSRFWVLGSGFGVRGSGSWFGSWLGFLVRAGEPRTWNLEPRTSNLRTPEPRNLGTPEPELSALSNLVRRDLAAEGITVQARHLGGFADVVVGLRQRARDEGFLEFALGFFEANPAINHLLHERRQIITHHE